MTRALTQFTRPAVVFAMVAGSVTLAGCGATPAPVLRAATPTIYLQSLREPDPVADCLANRLPSTRISARGDGVEIAVDGRKWLIQVSGADAEVPGGHGNTLIAAHRGKGGEDIEPEVRFAIARCTL